MLESRLGFAVDARRRFVEHQHIGFDDEGARKREQLPFALAERGAALFDRGQQALWQRADKVGGADGLKRAPDLCFVEVRVEQAHVVEHRARKQEQVLCDVGNASAQVAQIEVSHVLPIDAHGTTGDVAQARYQRQQGRLACTSGANDRDRLPRFGRERDRA